MSEPSWELLGGGGVLGPAGIDYIGAWDPAVAYQPGQIVRYNGVDYLACNPSTGQTPPPAVPANSLPPVVNGQWLKGAGGVPVWSAIGDADVPSLAGGARLGVYSANTADWNTAIGNGWYASNGGANQPIAGAIWFVGWTQIVSNGDPNYLAQTAFQPNLQGQVWQRTRWSGTWFPWQRTLPAMYAGSVNADGSVRAGSGFTSTHLSPGNYRITIPAPITTPAIVASAWGQSVVVGAAVESTSTFIVYVTTPSAWIDSIFQFAIWNVG